MFEDHGSIRIDLACPHCPQPFKVRLRKLQFGADLTCRLCRHEFSAREVSSRSEVQDALARMQTIVSQRMRDKAPRGSRDSREESGGADQHPSYARMTRPGMHGSGGAERLNRTQRQPVGESLAVISYRFQP
jgi:hypothetical protein